jgi:hypothetical protein
MAIARIDSVATRVVNLSMQNPEPFWLRVAEVIAFAEATRFARARRAAQRQF